ncbi:hypothetical protein C8R44DRAFT_867469 [Mycena epipterygia]|nr:hypothetical protein C8R44DRAFT_867469 [Mycena epipterygia]
MRRGASSSRGAMTHVVETGSSSPVTPVSHLSHMPLTHTPLTHTPSLAVVLSPLTTRTRTHIRRARQSRARSSLASLRARTGSVIIMFSCGALRCGGSWHTLLHRIAARVYLTTRAFLAIRCGVSSPPAAKCHRALLNSPPPRHITARVASSGPSQRCAVGFAPHARSHRIAAGDFVASRHSDVPRGLSATSPHRTSMQDLLRQVPASHRCRGFVTSPCNNLQQGLSATHPCSDVPRGFRDMSPRKSAAGTRSWRRNTLAGVEQGQHHPPLTPSTSRRCSHKGRRSDAMRGFAQDVPRGKGLLWGTS